MATTIEHQIAVLRKMTPGQLREKYLEVFGEASRSGNKDFLFKRIAWRIQSLAEGGLSDRARKRAEELARDADIRMTTPRQVKASGTGVVVSGPAAPTPAGTLPMPGAVLARQYRGRLIQVTVLPKGFEWDGQIFRSLSAVAKAVTGAHCRRGRCRFRSGSNSRS